MLLEVFGGAKPQADKRYQFDAPVTTPRHREE